MITNDNTPTPSAVLLTNAAQNVGDALDRLRAVAAVSPQCSAADYYRPAALFEVAVVASWDCGCWEGDCYCPEVPRAHECSCCTHAAPDEDDEHDCPSRACWHTETVETHETDNGETVAEIHTHEGNFHSTIDADDLYDLNPVGDARSNCCWVYGPCTTCADALALLRAVAGLSVDEWREVADLADDLAREVADPWYYSGEPSEDDWRAALASVGLFPAEHLAALVASRDSRRAGEVLADLLLSA